MDTHKALLRLTPNKVDLSGAIVEIGSQRHMQEGSTKGLCDLAQQHKVAFYTVDFSSKISEIAKKMVGESAINDDGAKFLSKFDKKISMLYLDNYDIVWSQKHLESLITRSGQVYKEKEIDISDSGAQNLMSARVHLDQAIAAVPLLTSKCIVAVDDTVYRKKDNFWWGKGALAVPYFLMAGLRVLLVEERGVILGRDVRAHLFL
jgi:hypothetical protein